MLLFLMLPDSWVCEWTLSGMQIGKIYGQRPKYGYSVAQVSKYTKAKYND